MIVGKAVHKDYRGKMILLVKEKDDDLSRIDIRERVVMERLIYKSCD
jgi:hypothetical protein